MTSTRTFTESRKAQGFRSQAHLDAFYAHYDHVKTCNACHPSSILTADGWQGVLVECDEARQLFLASLTENF